MAPDEKPPGIICVLGAHRSGTSCLTGSLQQAGLYLGPHQTWNPFNQRGNRENLDIDYLHQDLLAYNGGSWHQPPKGPVTWAPHHVERAREIIAEYPTDRTWGFKDPNTLVFLEGWRELLGEMTYIGIYRHPATAIRSLTARSGWMPTRQACDIWIHYNELLLAVLRSHRFPLLSFDWQEDTFHDKLDSVLPELGLSRLPEGERFFAPELRHHEDPESVQLDIELPPRATEIYDELRSFAI